MPIPTIKFEKKGKPLSVELEFLSPQVATYTLWLWEANSNTIVWQKRGNNENPEDDVFQLPTPCSINKGRLIEATCTLIDPQGSGPYSIRLSVRQGSTVLDSIQASGTMENTSTTCTLVATLSTR